MISQANTIYEMLSSGRWVCTTEMMEKFIPDYRRRLCDLADKGVQLEGKRCGLHKHKSRNLKMWRLLKIYPDN